jgi:hypothetical protein
MIPSRCGKNISRHRGSNFTSNLNKHADRCTLSHDARPQQQMMDAFSSGSTYTREKLQTLLVRWIMGCCRPMSIVRDSEFLAIIKMLNLRAGIPSWNTVTTDIKTMYSLTKAQLKGRLQVHIIILLLTVAVLT